MFIVEFVDLIYSHLSKFGDFGLFLSLKLKERYELVEYFTQLASYLHSDIHSIPITLCFLSSGFATAEYLIAYFIKHILQYPIESIMLSDHIYTDNKHIIEDELELVIQHILPDEDLLIQFLNSEQIFTNNNMIYYTLKSSSENRNIYFIMIHGYTAIFSPENIDSHILASEDNESILSLLELYPESKHLTLLGSKTDFKLKRKIQIIKEDLDQNICRFFQR